MEDEKKSKYSKLSIAAFVLSLIPIIPWFLAMFFVFNRTISIFILLLASLTPIITLILSVISIKIIKKNNLKGKTLSIISLIISIINLIVYWCIFLIAISLSKGGP